MRNCGNAFASTSNWADCLGADFTDFEIRSNAATLAGDESSLDVLAREMFVHLVSELAEEFEATIAQRNELTQLVPTPSADVELDAIRESIRLGDLPGALRRLTHVRDELLRVEEEWEVGRILVTECDLLVQTIRELGGDPAPAQGPLEEGRKFLSRGRRSDAEKLLARAAVALWTVLEPRFFEDLRRVRDRLNDCTKFRRRHCPGGHRPPGRRHRATAAQLCGNAGRLPSPAGLRRPAHSARVGRRGGRCPRARRAFPPVGIAN